MTTNMPAPLPAPAPQSLFREAFAKFLEDPSRDKFHELLRDSGGEFRDLDFKEEWPAKASVVKQALALGNIGGGVLVVGVRERSDGAMEPVGLSSLTDKADVTQWLKGTVPSTLLERISVHDFVYPTADYGVVQGKKFQAMFVQPNPHHLPFLPLKEGDKITPGAIYIRREGMIDVASYEEVQRILNDRIEGGHSTQPELDLQAHLDQLRVLYGAIPRTKAAGWLGPAGAEALLKGLGGISVPNPHYPAESFEQFVAAGIEAKKRVILRALGAARE